VVSRIRKQLIVHFGDLDPKGIAIFQALINEGFPVQHFVPSYVEEFVLTNAQTCDSPWAQREFAPMHSVVSKLAAQGLWLEQEALVLDHRFEREVNSLIEGLAISDEPSQ
jgi:hypothetical protein